MPWYRRMQNQKMIGIFDYEVEHTHISTSLLVLGSAGNRPYFCTLLLYLHSSISVARIPSKKGPAKRMDCNVYMQVLYHT